MFLSEKSFGCLEVSTCFSQVEILVSIENVFPLSPFILGGKKVAQI